MLTDTHAHLYWDSFKQDFDAVIQRTLDAGVNTIINVGVDVDLSKKALSQVEEELSRYKGLTAYSTIGIHPHKAEKYLDDEKLTQDILTLEQIYNSNPEKVVGVGECGLDYFFSHSAEAPRDRRDIEKLKDLQRKLLTAQINLAKRLNLPLIIHVRDDRSKNPDNSECWEEILKLTQDHFGIFHCYSGTMEITQKVLNHPFLISFAATLTYPKNDSLREAAKLLPIDKIVLETDCPFLPPQSKRGGRNEPQTVKEIAELIAELKEIPLEEVGNQTTKNVFRLFKL